MFKLKHLARRLLPPATTPARALPPDADALLEQSDRARGCGLTGVRLYSSVTEYRGEQPGSELRLEIVAAATDSLISFTSPPRLRGTRMLMRGRDMWFASPDVRQPVAISPRQPMLGEASNGDIATANYSRDYDAALVGEGTADGRPVWVLDLTAKSAAVVYERVRYFIDKDTGLGIKAEFSGSGHGVLKTARMEYDNHVRHHGTTVRFVSRIDIADAAEPGRHTVLRFWDVTVDDIAAAALSLADLEGADPALAGWAA